MSRNKKDYYADDFMLSLPEGADLFEEGEFTARLNSKLAQMDERARGRFSIDCDDTLLDEVFVLEGGM